VQQEAASMEVTMKYDDKLASMYRDWVPQTLDFISVRHTALQFFENLAGKTVVDFGCGPGDFLKTCLEKGAASCLGIDANDAMIKAGGNVVSDESECRQNDASAKLRFIVKDCLKPFEKSHGGFDFAHATYFIYACKNETDLQIFLKNAYQMIKSHGKFYIGQNPFAANTAEDQEIIGDLCGFFQPLKSDLIGRVPAYEEIPAFRPVSDPERKPGKRFTRDHVFNFQAYYWPKEKVMQKLEEAGFINVKLLPPLFPDDISMFEKKQIESLEEPFILIGAEKP